MKIIKGIKNFGIWCKKGRYHLTNNDLAGTVVKKGFAKEIMDISQNDIAIMFADFKLNGIPKELVKYFQTKKDEE